VVGAGCERGNSGEALAHGLDQFVRENGFAQSSVTTLASVDLKADEAALTELAARHGWQTLLYTAEALAEVSDAPNPSAVVQRCVGTPGVAEPAALLAASVPRLLVEKRVVASPLAPQRMTFALARRAGFETAGPPRGKVVFVGAGPGDPDLLTVKGHRALTRADVVVYAGSLVPEEMLRHAPGTVVLHNSAPLTLEEVTAQLICAAQAGKCVVRLHSGDTSLYSAIQEQIAVLDAAGVEYEVIPGISSFQAAAAALQVELTVPEVVQTVILTRAEGQTPMPEGEMLSALASHRATLCIFLSARLVEQVQEKLLTAYPPETPAAICYRISWPEEKVIITTIKDLALEVRRHQLVRTTLILVGAALVGRRNRSRLYHSTHGHIFRARGREESHPLA
jgi:precorrin-4 C11-methyltransferase